MSHTERVSREDPPSADRVPGPRPGPARVALANAAFGVAVLVFLAAPHWAGVIDDLFITTAYAYEWWDNGQLRWTSGEVVEGYSNFSWLLLMTAGVAAGVDTLLLAKEASLASACAFVAIVALAAPRDLRGTVAVLAFAAWAPMGYWAAMGMETPLFALLLAVGWTSCLADRDGWRGAGAAVLTLAALTHPEGHAHLALALAAAVARRPRWERGDSLAVAAVVLLVVYHAWRVHHFGHFWPAPFLSKVAGAAGYEKVAPQLGRELLTSVGVLVAIAGIVQPRPKQLPWVLAPVALQIGLLVSANGDWMAWARFLLPGICATGLTALVVLPHRVTSRWTAIPAAAVVLATSMLEPRQREVGLELREVRKLASPIEHYTSGFGSALPQDTEYIVENVPDGDIVFASDVGIIGNIPGVRVRDIVGLVDRRIAEFRASGATYDPVLGAREYGTGPDQIAFLRVVNWAGGETATLDEHLRARFVSRQDVYANGFHATWYRVHEERPSREATLRRWRELHRRYPSMKWLEWRHLIAEVDAGGAVRTEPERGHHALEAIPESLSFTRGPMPLTWEAGRGFALYTNGTLTSRPLDASDLAAASLVLDVQDPGDDGAIARVALQPCTTGLVVPERAVVPLRDLCPAARPGARLDVTFLNDLATAEADRNLYAYVTSSPAEPAR